MQLTSFLARATHRKFQVILGSGVMVRATLAALQLAQQPEDRHLLLFTQSHGTDRAHALQDPYTLLTLGQEGNGREVNSQDVIDFAACLYTGNDLELSEADLLGELICSPNLAVLHTNQREDGFKTTLRKTLFDLLLRRYQNGGHPITVLCWELILANGTVMKEPLIQDAQQHDTANSTHFTDWIKQHVAMPITVQNIICVESLAQTHPALRAPDWATVMEPVPMFGVTIEENPLDRARYVCQHPNIAYRPTNEVLAIFRTKNWLLNKLHVLLVARWLAEDLQCQTVLEAMQLPGIKDWLLACGKETIALHGNELLLAEEFLEDVLRRFENPWLAHKLAAIAAGIETKWGVRVQPTLDKITGDQGALLRAAHAQHLSNVADGNYDSFQKK